ncbi:extracellular solute-binding protein [Luteimicrobium xylanilyticum]|uniref:Uncharacterized protein n=1 Tax=Luteimicrobium xylanilyticum TaxID=1133546 RepID=A0A5P9QER0_9MICO|nr:extracellular solute-binding protein [Luteimicrobium xylanilyticum]QFU99759.1 hypothetical protein KDY119_03295 [Luteimicrobium xylanilyticum]
MRKHRGVLAAAAAAAALALTLAGCSGSSDGSGAATGGDGKTLKVWWWENDDSALSDAWNKAIDIFKEKHPGVKVEFELKTYDQMQQSGQLILDSKDTPDVLEYLKGNATAGSVAKAGLLTDLTQVAKDRGWDLDNSAQDVGLYDASGVMGTGKRYGVTNYGEYVGMYYNKDLFAKYGLSVPTSLDELESDMQTFVDHKITPLALGSNDYPGEHLLYQLALLHMNHDSWSAYQQFTGEPDWSAWQQAAQTYQDWVKKGYIAKSSTGVSAQDSGNAFEAGKYPMFYSGTWWAGTFQDKIKSFKWDQFRWPDTTFTPGSGGNIWVVPAKAENKTLAEDFIEITLSPEIQNMLGNKAGVPIAADPSAVTSPVGTLQSTTFNKLLAEKDGGLAWYPDWPAAGLNDVLLQQISSLTQGTTTPDQLVDAIKSAYEQGKPAGK